MTTFHRINGYARKDPVQDAIASIEHYLFRGTATMACCLVLTDGTSVISLTTHDHESGDLDLSALQARSRADAEKMVHNKIFERTADGNQQH